tara:strand:- start:229 stop:576 length:348 start_codon:yes stop_codon:yes gene_type:complete
MNDNCQICRKHPIQHKDYRFLDNCGLQGKVLVCEWCIGLNDVAISKIVRDELNPKDLYRKELNQMAWNKLTKEEKQILKTCKENNCPDCDKCVPILESQGAYFDFCEEQQKTEGK